MGATIAPWRAFGCGAQASYGPSLREKVVDVSRRLSESALSLQVRAGRGDSITFGIENRDLITIVALVLKYKLVSAMAVCAGRHLNLLHETWIRRQMVPARQYLTLLACVLLCCAGSTGRCNTGVSTTLADFEPPGIPKSVFL
jgi:hypothetical protein